MNKQKKQCKIIYDLLPLYIDNLTTSETNEYIEDHIQKCSECMQTLKNMNGEINLDKIDRNVEINGLRKVKQRLRIQILLSITVVILIFIICIHINNNYTITTDDGQLSIKSYNSKVTISNLRYLVIKGKRLRKDTIDGYLYKTNIATLNDKNICTNMRCIETGYTDNMINEIYKNLIATEDMNVSTNISLKDNKLYYNDNMYNGKNINDVIDDLKNYYNEIEIIEEM